MPKANKLISSQKCQRCRHDKQKCLPEGRQWPGRRCDRCIRYDYVCSANRTRSEEQSAGKGADSLPTQASLSAPVSPASVPQLLQVMGDLRQIIKIYHRPIWCPTFFWITRYDERLDGVVVMLRLRAEQFLRDGNYKDAEYLYSQILGSKELAESEGWAKKEIDFLPDLVSLYEHMGNFSAAEAFQEHCLRRAFESDDYDVDDEAEKLYRLYGLFYDRIRDIIIQTDGLSDDGAASARLCVFYRAAALDVDPFSRVIATGRRIRVPQLAFHIAIEADATSLIAMLLENGACVRKTTGVYKLTALHVAVRNSRPGIVRQLVEAGADVNARNRAGSTALMQASLSGSVEMVQLLVVHGPDAGSRETFRRTALNFAMRQSSPSSLAIVEMLLDSAPHAILEVDVKGNTPLHQVVLKGYEPHERILNLLLERFHHKTEIFAALNEEGNTPLHLAAILENWRMVKMLLIAQSTEGARVNILTRNDKGERVLELVRSSDVRATGFNFQLDEEVRRLVENLVTGYETYE